MQQSRYRKTNIPKAVRIAVWNTYISEEIGKAPCYVGCGRSIAQSNFECGHIEAESKGGLTTIDNLRPICGDCNRSMGTRNMHEFMETFGFKKDKEIILVEDKEDDNKPIVIDDNEPIVIDDNEPIVIEEDYQYQYQYEDKDKEIILDNQEININELLNYFIENCIEYKKGSNINFDEMYQFFIGISPAFYDTHLVDPISKEQFIDYFVQNYNSYCEFNLLYDYKFKYEVKNEECIEECNEQCNEECNEEFFDTVGDENEFYELI